ncbi:MULTISPECIES: Rad52/Rad22 family DNA repair protein [unclassified Roseitalea]|uniref:Rad52/Rad22 family DNA repair protein n=1 Tax=unclassified Roseitalea TaxID=2639107 RepID=UPI00273F8E4D|nr:MULTISPECIES: Rad52/Rad22 family DNA repair protein [unclassified Roseitalea]
MGFSDRQTRQLRAKLKPRHVRSRSENGAVWHYLEGWHVIAEANRIFGFDGWHRQTVESQCVHTKHQGMRYVAVYVTRVRVTVRAAGQDIVREGSGAGEANAVSPGQAHEFALKAAETDATKRALMTFGNAFGLSLHAGHPVKAGPGMGNGAMPDTGGQPRGANGQWRAGNGAADKGQHAGASRNDDDASTDATPDSPASDAGEPSDDPPAASLSRPVTPIGKGRAATVPIDKSALTLSEPRRERDPAHLRHVASRPCLICGRNRAQAHHVTFAQPSAMGRKVSDAFTVPLCSAHHRALHQRGDERAFWAEHGIDPLETAKELWAQTRERDKHSVPERHGAAGAQKTG